MLGTAHCCEEGAHGRRKKERSGRKQTTAPLTVPLFFQCPLLLARPPHDQTAGTLAGYSNKTHGQEVAGERRADHATPLQSDRNPATTARRRSGICGTPHPAGHAHPSLIIIKKIIDRSGRWSKVQKPMLADKLLRRPPLLRPAGAKASPTARPQVNPPHAPVVRCAKAIAVAGRDRRAGVKEDEKEDELPPLSANQARPPLFACAFFSVRATVNEL